MGNYFSDRQLEQLIKPLNPARVESLDKGGKSLSYLNHADVRAHLTRIFGFGRWDTQVIDAELLFSEPDEREVERRGEKKLITYWYVGWRATVQLRVRSPNGCLMATYAETAIGGNTQPQHHEASDMALKSAVSDALKRCAINLGDQFGLGLYQDSNGPIVRAVLWPEPPEVSEGDETIPEPDITNPAEHDGKLAHAIGYNGDSAAGT